MGGASACASSGEGGIITTGQGLSSRAPSHTAFGGNGGVSEAEAALYCGGGAGSDGTGVDDTTAEQASSDEAPTATPAANTVARTTLASVDEVFDLAETGVGSVFSDPLNPFSSR